MTKIKSAEEWAIEVLDEASLAFENTHFRPEELAAIVIKKIQLEAYKAGLEKADDIAWSKRDNWEDQFENDGYIQYKVQAAEEIGNAIRKEKSKNEVGI